MYRAALAATNSADRATLRRVADKLLARLDGRVPRPLRGEHPVTPPPGSICLAARLGHLGKLVRSCASPGQPRTHPMPPAASHSARPGSCRCVPANGRRGTGAWLAVVC
jgi:hypothetical protein